jgi:hypothetical protein
VLSHGPDVASLRALVDSLPALIHTGRPDGFDVMIGGRGLTGLNGSKERRLALTPERYGGSIVREEGDLNPKLLVKFLKVFHGSTAKDRHLPPRSVSGGHILRGPPALT